MLRENKHVTFVSVSAMPRLSCGDNTNVARWHNTLGVGGVHHAKDELDDCAVKLQTSAQQVLIQKAHISTSFGSNKFLIAQNQTHRRLKLKTHPTHRGFI